MARQLALTPFLTGEPVALDADVSTPGDILRALGPQTLEAPGVLAVTSRVALIHSLTGAAEGLAIRVVRLPHAPRLDDAGPVDAAIVLTASFRESGVALRLVARLKAGLRLPMAASGDLYRRATTMTLAGIVATQVGNVFACRTDRESVFRVGLLANRVVLGSIAAEVAILMALILVPPFPHVFGLAPLAFAEWGILLLFPPAVLLLEEGRKWIVRMIWPR